MQYYEELTQLDKILLHNNNLTYPFRIADRLTYIVHCVLK